MRLLDEHANGTVFGIEFECIFGDGLACFIYRRGERFPQELEVAGHWAISSSTLPYIERIEQYADTQALAKADPIPVNKAGDRLSNCFLMSTGTTARNTLELETL